MHDLSLRKIPFTVEAENRLRFLKARTGLTRNVLCRLGFCLSLEEPGSPRNVTKDTEVAREIDRYTLLGQHGVAYIALLIAWLQSKGYDTKPGETIDAPFVAHMNRGVELLGARVKSLVDMADLLPKV